MKIGKIEVAEQSQNWTPQGDKLTVTVIIIK